MPSNYPSGGRDMRGSCPRLRRSGLESLSLPTADQSLVNQDEIHEITITFLLSTMRGAVLQHANDIRTLSPKYQIILPTTTTTTYKVQIYIFHIHPSA